jgi:hypothetical protein
VSEYNRIDEEIKALKGELENVQGTECEVYSRIVGYYRNVNNWNPGKKDEYGLRKVFDDLDYEAVEAGERGHKNMERKEYEARPVNPNCPWH